MKTLKSRMVFGATLGLALALTTASCGATKGSSAVGQTIVQAYPGLASISLEQAVLAKLPKGILMRSGSVTINMKDLDAEIAKAPVEVREQLQKNGFYLMEKMATGKLLVKVAKEQLTVSGKDASGLSDNDVIKQYVLGLTDGIAVSDSEVAAFYKENRDACGGASLEQMSGQLNQYLLQEKKQAFVTEHVRGLGELTPIEVSASWVKDQAVLARDNPVDKARTSGLPSMVDFGSTGCRPCDMMAPILEELKAEYAGKANVLFVQVNQEQLLAARFGIQSIPVQVFFDKTGQEVSRHVGFFPKDEILKQLRAMGVE